jgi:hypothetical protein
VAERRLVSDGKLPPLLPVVLYNGDARWRAPAAVRDLVGLPEASRLWRWQPDLLYHLIDASTFSTADLAARDGLPALWFRLERADDPAQVVAIADGLIAWLGRHSGFSDARRVFVELLSAVMARSGVGPQAAEDFLDMRSRLLERAEQWQQEWRLEGLEKGLQQGLQEGREKGLQEGRQEGLHEGRKAGREEGREEGREQGREEGRLEGEAALLLRLLERRFGLLPDWAVDRVRASNIAMLDEWGMRLLDAESLDEVLEAPSG